MKKSLPTHLLLYSTLFAIFYFETYSISGITVSLAWKLVLLLFLLAYISKKPLKPPLFITISIAIVIKSLFSTGFIEYPLETISPIIGWISIPAIFLSIRAYLGTSDNHHAKEKKYMALERNFKLFAVFISLSCIPFWLGLKPLIQEKTLVSFGLEESIFQGFYQNMHAAAGVLSAASICLLFFAKNEKSKHTKIIFLSLALICLYSLIKTYVRTGLLMLVVGLLAVYIQDIKKSTLKSIISITAALAAITITIYFNETLLARILDQRVHSTYNDYRDIGSGRLYIWEVSIKNLVDQGFIAILFGLGTGLSKALMSQSTGLSLVSHSGFVDSIVQNGIIGLILFIIYLYSLRKHIRKYPHSNYTPLANALFWMYITFQFVQGGNQFIFAIILSATLNLIEYRGFTNAPHTNYRPIHKNQERRTNNPLRKPLQNF